MKRKYFCIFMVCLIMYICFLAISGHAETTYTCEDGVLAISGTGDMSDVCRYGSTPWENLADSVHTVYVEDGITGIGDHAFEDFSILKEVHLPQELETIGYGVFRRCYALQTIVIPDNVTYINNDIFKDSPTVVYTSLNSKTAKALGRSNTPFRTEGSGFGFIYNTDNNTATLELIYADETMESAIIPMGVQRIGDNVFENNVNLVTVSFPSSLEIIGREAFKGCENLKNVSIPSGVTEIEYSAFEDCINLSTVTLHEGLQIIDGRVFCNCPKLTQILLPETITLLEHSVFSGCTSLSTVNIPSKITSIENWTFSDTAIENVELPEGITFIGFKAFDCKKLKSIKLPQSLTTLDYACILSDSLTSIEFPDHIQTVDEYALGSRSPEYAVYVNKGSTTALTFSKAKIPFRFPGTQCDIRYEVSENDQITGVYLISVDKDVESFDFPEGTTVITRKCFSDCSNMTSLTIPDGVTTIETNAFLHHQLSKIFIPDSVKVFGEYAMVSYTTTPTVYCHEFSDAEIWARDRNYPVVLIDYKDVNEIRTIQLPESIKISVWEQKQLHPTVFPLYDQPMIQWESSNTDVIAVENGLLVPSACGQATVTASIGTVTASTSVWVYLPAESFQLSNQEAWITAKDSIQLSPTNLLPEGSEVLLTWSSTDTTVASVDQNGLVTTQKPGDVIITATSQQNVVAECQLHVCYPVTDVQFETDKLTINYGESMKVTATVTTRDGKAYQNRMISFSSSDESTATVSETGDIYGVHPGEVIITASSGNGIIATLTVTVVCKNHQPVLEPTVSPTETSQGSTGGSKCGVCGKVLSESQIIPALSELDVLQLPSSLLYIQENAFQGIACEAIIIPQDCVSIASGAFSDCKSLIYVCIPALTEVSDEAFQNCKILFIDRK